MRRTGISGPGFSPSGRGCRRGSRHGYRHGSRRGSRRDGGSVTAELAVALPAVILVLAAVLATGQALVVQLRCVDAARAAARLAARGEPDDVSAAAARQLGPAGSGVDIVNAGADVTVRVVAQVRLPLGMSLPVGAVAAARREQP